MATQKIFYPTAEKLSFLLQMIHHRELALPDFQRDFVWDARATDELIESLARKFPAGSLLRIKNSVDFLFAPREFAGAPPLNGHMPSYLILDGQQRLTSLYQSFYGAGEHRFFFDVRPLEQEIDLEDRVFYDRSKRAERRFGTLEAQGENLVFPLSRLFREGGGFDEWLYQMLDIRGGSPEERSVLRKQIREVYDLWLRPLEDYEFPVVNLEEKTTAEAVCTIFETLNRTGVKLGVFDLLAARFWPEHIRLRDMWQAAVERHPILTRFEIDPYYVLQAVALYAADGAPSCKKGDVLKMHVDQVQQGWDPVIHGLVEVLLMLHDECGVLLPNWLPYYTILIPMAAVWASELRGTGPKVGANRQKLLRWFWCSVFAQAYEKAPNSQTAKDFGELRRWMKGGEAPQTVSEFHFDSTQLRNTNPRQRALYRGVIAVIIRHGAKDFHGLKPLSGSTIIERKIEDHHVFPQAYLRDHRSDVTATVRDCALNRALIDKITNARIGGRAPSDYLSEIEEEFGSKKIRELLASHLLPAGPNSSLLKDDFDAFLDEREQAIAREVEALTG